MNTKKCSNCGWEYAEDWPGRTCKFCHAPMPEAICSICGNVYYNTKRPYCRDCETKQHSKWRGKIRKDTISSYDKWLSDIKSLPTPYVTLTEEQWNKVCRHFNGCAYCGEPEIASRSMFIEFAKGGRYCSWNIIPACEKCETSRVVQPNPFMRMNEQLNRSADSSTRVYGFTKENLQRIVDYLYKEMNSL